MNKNMTKKQDDLQKKIDEEWRKMHHNASISHYMPDFRNEYERDMFWDQLARKLKDLLCGGSTTLLGVAAL